MRALSLQSDWDDMSEKEEVKLYPVDPETERDEYEHVADEFTQTLNSKCKDTKSSTCAKQETLGEICSLCPNTSKNRSTYFRRKTAFSWNQSK